MKQSIQNIELSIWPYENKEELKKTFEGLDVKIDIRAAIGAGASGILPELNLLLVVGAGLLAKGFLSAVGKDAWELIKKSVVKLTKRKPKKKEIELSVPPDYKGPYQYELIWWIHFNDRKILVTLGLSTEHEVITALNLLPQAINSGFMADSQISRLVWNGKSWEGY